ncbi:glycosyltransferase [Lichenicoccus sp.]|uniref:glycosyltransferase n=1 Tax=Lichenicoccus sp. TaxID=2781899 RepID=UPI003D0A35B7
MRRGFTQDHGTPNKPVTFLLYSGFTRNIEDALGEPEYSYHFVLNGFRAALAEIGSTIVITSLSEVDATLDMQEEAGAQCVLLCFMPPHQAPISARCPVFCVFAWEFSNIPDEIFEQDPRSDWRRVFACHGRAISLSEHAARLVREAMGAGFPVFAIAVPLPERLLRLGQRDNEALSGTIAIRGSLYDTRAHGPYPEQPVWTPPSIPSPAPEPIEASVADGPTEASSAAQPPAAPSRLRVSFGVSRYYALMWYRDAVRTLLPSVVTRMISTVGRFYTRVRLVLKPPVSGPPKDTTAPEPALPIMPPEDAPVAGIKSVEPLQRVALFGVVYTAVFNPKDGRKNWHDMLTAFCWAFRDNPDVTLVMKMAHHDRSTFEGMLALLLERLQPFRCRIITLHGWLDDDEYDALIRATDYYVNTSSCEGLCLPLMEFMSAARPAIAPDHTAMADYINEDNAFVLSYGTEYNVWPHDPRDLFRTMRHRLEWDSLVDAYRASHRIRLDDPARYAAMGRAARQVMRETCSVPVVRAKLDQAIRQA